MKKFILAMMLCVFCLVSFAMAEDENDLIFGEGRGSITEENDISSEEALNWYIQHELFSDETLVSNDGRSHLTGAERKLYDTLKKGISEVAKGKRESTVFKMKASSIFGTKKFRSSSEMDNWVWSTMNEVVHYLMIDCPYELYWFDKTEGWYWSYWYKYSGGYYYLTSTFEVRLSVAYEYSWGDFTFDTSYALSIQNAVNNAKDIVNKNSGLDDIAKLRAYKDTICKLTDYNHDAWGEDGALMDYGNPWQFVWVFDGNENTKVVCEGYAKAFQYLCQLSKFNQKIEVMSLYGDVFYEGSGGGHMWNIVSIDKSKNYLVDVTWCDEGSYGSDILFMAGYSWKIGNRQFFYPYYGGEVEYTYDDELIELFSSAELGIISGPYWELYTPEKLRKIEADAFSFSGCYSVRLNELVTSIGERAFYGCRNLKAVYIPSGCREIAENAFDECYGLTIYGKSSSYAEEYAIENEIPFQAMP